MFSGAINGNAAPTDGLDEDGNDEAAALPDDAGVSAHRGKAPFAPGSSEENSYEEMSMAEIMTGKGDYFPGLIPLLYAYLDHINCDKVTRSRLEMYLDFIERRAVGELVTPATWMRKFVRSHPDYKRDSVVSDQIA
jgi:glutamate--cysteine ligase catalytic subunit